MHITVSDKFSSIRSTKRRARTSTHTITTSNYTSIRCTGDKGKSRNSSVPYVSNYEATKMLPRCDVYCNAYEYYIL